MQGVGERIAALEAFRGRTALLVNPGVAVSTPAVFGRLGLKTGEGFGAPIAEAGDIAGWRNDLAPAAIALAPVIGEVIAGSRRSRASPAAMSGSGATCYALLDDGAETPDAAPGLVADADLARLTAGQWARATQKSTASRSASFSAESGKIASASRAMSP